MAQYKVITALKTQAEADKSKALLGAGVTMIKVSIDGNNKEEFEKIRKGLKWNTVKKM